MLRAEGKSDGFNPAVEVENDQMDIGFQMEGTPRGSSGTVRSNGRLRRDSAEMNQGGGANKPDRAGTRKGQLRRSSRGKKQIVAKRKEVNRGRRRDSRP